MSGKEEGDFKAWASAQIADGNRIYPLCSLMIDGGPMVYMAYRPEGGLVSKFEVKPEVGERNKTREVA